MKYKSGEIVMANDLCSFRTEMYLGVSVLDSERWVVVGDLYSPNPRMRNNVTGAAWYLPADEATLVKRGEVNKIQKRVIRD